MTIKASKLLKDLINCFRTIYTLTCRFNTIFNIMSAIAKGTKKFLQYFCFKWNRVKLGESLFSWWMLLFHILVERKKGVLYLLRIKIILYGTGWPLILEISEIPEKSPKLKSFPRKCLWKFLNWQNPLKFSRNTPENPWKFLLCDFFFKFLKFSYIKSILHFRHLFSFLYISSQISLLQAIFVSKVSGLNNQYSV